MKALSVKQPWAWLIANGHKTIETRTRNTHYRGDLIIASSKGTMKKAVKKDFFEKYPQAKGDVLYGQALCIVTLSDCMEMVADHQKAACCERYPNAKSWFLSNVRKIEPFPVVGRLSLYTIELSICTCGKSGQERFDKGLYAGIYCDACWDELVKDCRKRSW